MSEPLSFRKSANIDRVTDKRKDSLFRLVDTDGSGTIDAQEFAVLYDAIKKDLAEELEKEAVLQQEASSARRRFKMLLLFVAVLISFLAASVAANFAVIFTVVDNAVTTTSDNTGTFTAKGSDIIVKTAVATQDFPLIVAPALDSSSLSSVKKLKITYDDDGNENVEEDLTVVSVRKHNSTYVEFVSSVPGDSVETLNGVASLVRRPTAANGLKRTMKYGLCESNATCSAFKASGTDVSAALAKATEELEKHGFAKIQNRRQMLAYGMWMTWSYTGDGTTGTVAKAKCRMYNAYSGTRHLVFMLHGYGGDGEAWYNAVGSWYDRPEYRHLMFCYPDSSTTNWDTNWYTWVKSWNDDHSSGAYEYLNSGLPQLGALYNYLVAGNYPNANIGPASKIMSFGISDGGRMSVIANLFASQYSVPVFCAGGFAGHPMDHYNTHPAPSGFHGTVDNYGVRASVIWTDNDNYYESAAWNAYVAGVNPSMGYTSGSSTVDGHSFTKEEWTQGCTTNGIECTNRMIFEVNAVTSPCPGSGCDWGVSFDPATWASSHGTFCSDGGLFDEWYTKTIEQCTYDLPQADAYGPQGACTCNPPLINEVACMPADCAPGGRFHVTFPPPPPAPPPTTVAQFPVCQAGVCTSRKGCAGCKRVASSASQSFSQWLRSNPEPPEDQKSLLGSSTLVTYDMAEASDSSGKKGCKCEKISDPKKCEKSGCVWDSPRCYPR